LTTQTPSARSAACSPSTSLAGSRAMAAFSFAGDCGARATLLAPDDAMIAASSICDGQRDSPVLGFKK
jgi:hypothetical protein